MKKTFVLTGLLLTTFIIIFGIFTRPYSIQGDCMEPTIKDGQLCFANLLAPYLGSYKINDIVCFNHEGKTWFSRVIGLAGDTIQITNNSITINGCLIQKNPVRNWTNWEHGLYGINKPYLIPNGHVFVLSDNLAAQHDDSRTFGPILKESIQGILIFIG